MSESNHSVIPGMLAAFAVGATLGAGLAMLYAPRAGKETRELVGKKIQGLRDVAGQAITQGRQFADDAAHSAHDLYDKGKTAVSEIGQTAAHAA